MTVDSRGHVPLRRELFAANRVRVTIGIVLLVSMVAFETMSVGTAMPALIREMGDVGLYAWPFVTFMAASVVGSVVAGRWCDIAGPRGPLLVAPISFGLGLLVSGTAQDMVQLLTGRVLQGVGGGLLVAIYVLVGTVYPERVRPAVFALMSSAYVLPALLGPPVAGLLTQHQSWRWVFLVLLPFVVIAFALVAPALRAVRPAGGREQVRPGLLPAALAAAGGVSGLSWAGSQRSATALAVGLGAVALLVPALARLTPKGTLLARRGLPAVVLSRGLLVGVFMSLNAYLPLMLTATHGWSVTEAGTPLILGSLSWSAAAAWQGRRPDLSRPTMLRVGFAVNAATAAVMAVVATPWGPPWLAFPLWMVAGTGMGIGFSAVLFLVLREADPAEVGFSSSAAQIAEQLGISLMVGLGGAALAAFGTPAVALPVFAATCAALALLGVVLAGRVTRAAGGAGPDKVPAATAADEGSGGTIPEPDGGRV